jgi:hypothetical protein
MKRRKDAVAAALKDIRRDAQRRVNRSATKDESEQASADWHIADEALRVWKRGRRRD